jgi:hypothetical protein
VERAFTSDQQEAELKRRAMAVDQLKQQKQREDARKSRAADKLLGLSKGKILAGGRGALAQARASGSQAQKATLPPPRLPASARAAGPSPFAPKPKPRMRSSTLTPRTARPNSGELDGIGIGIDARPVKLKAAKSLYGSPELGPRMQLKDHFASSTSCRRVPRRFPT